MPVEYMLFGVCTSVFLILCSGKSVTTPVGTIVGFERKLEFAGKQFVTDRYLGIPYAEAPVGERRFKKPVPRRVFSSPFNATLFGPACPQYAIPGIEVPDHQSEDCLLLNVHVPTQNPDNENGHAVMIFIHGGGFMLGAANTYVGDTLAAHGNVIVVTINYRLGIFGFLTSLDEHAEANLGLWDQHLAFQWVHKNIYAFGGDTERVTIFGESAGSMSAMYQAFFPPNKGLFQRVIGQSGSNSLKVLSMRDAPAALDYVAGVFECDKTDTSTIVACLRKFDWKDVINKIKNLGTEMNVMMQLQFFPIKDGDFIKRYPAELLEAAKSESVKEIEFFRSLDIVFGANSDEGGLYVEDFSETKDITNFQPTQEEMQTKLVPGAIFTSLGAPPSELAVKLVSAVYTDWSKPEDGLSLRDQYTQMLGDVWFIIPAIELARAHVNASSGRSYVYLFTPAPETHLIPTTPSWLSGANHADDLLFVFGFDEESRHFFFSSSVIPPPVQWETEVSSAVVEYWSNFAKTGNPSSDRQVWPEYDLSSQQYLEINRGGDRACKYFKAEKANLWLDILPLVSKLSDITATSPQAEDGSCSADGDCDGA